MHIQELINQLAKPPENSVPEWMLGCFERRSISFATGQTDNDTHVFWLQGRNMTIDLRLPIEEEQVGLKAFNQYSPDELRVLTNYEGWYAETVWQNDLLSWEGGCSFQIHMRWPEPGIMHRIGDCMIEFSPSAAYVEDWRLKNRFPGPLVSLRLIDECELESGLVRHRDGALILCGNWAGLVLGRTEPIVAKNNEMLRDIVIAGDTDLLECIFNFETSIAEGDVNQGFTVNYTSCKARMAEPLFALEGFSVDEKTGEVLHCFDDAGVSVLRRFSVDSIERNQPFTLSTPMSEKSKKWFASERETLGRYF